MSGQGRDKGGGKSRSGGGSIKITKTKEMLTKELDEKVIHLRKAIFADNGKDKDVTVGIAPAFLKFDRNGLNVDINFSPRLTEEEKEWAFEIARDNMEEIYDASGYGWDDSDKMNEMTEEGTRFLLAREKQVNDVPGRLVAFAHFRFTIQGEVMDKMAGETSLHIWDIHVDETHQRKGLGKHLLTLMELIARREKMKMICIPVQLNDECTVAWLSKVGKGFSPDKSLLELVGFDADMEGFEVYSKALVPPVPRAPAPAPTPTLVPAVTPVSVPLSIPASVFDTDPVHLCSVIDPAVRSSDVTALCGDDDWEIVSKRDAGELDCQGVEEKKSSDEHVREEKTNDMTKTGVEAEGEAEAEGLSVVEIDLIEQIEAMFRVKTGREGTAVEKMEWLRSIREVSELKESDDVTQA